MATEDTPTPRIVTAVDAKMFAAASICVSREETRYYLNGVYIEPHPDGGAVLVATDGHRMMIIHDQAGRCEGPIIVGMPASGLKACGRNSIEPLLVTVDAFGVATVGNLWRSPKSCIIDGTFPDYRKAIPFNDDWLHNPPAIFNARYLGDFGRISNLLGSDINSIRVFFQSSIAEPCLVAFPKAPHAFGIIMPLYQLETPAGIPRWMMPMMKTADPAPSDPAAEAAE